MNIVRLLKPKAEVAFVREDNTLRQALEKMKYHGYSALPVINKRGEYIGTVSEGDFLWKLIGQDKGISGFNEEFDLCGENITVSDIMKKGFNPAVTIDTSMDDLLLRVMDTNFVPVSDDRNIFMGIITRRDVIKYFRTVKIFNENLLAAVTARV